MKFRAYLIEQESGGVKSGFVDLDESQLDPGQVTLRVAFSSVNYKDALAATGAGKIIRRFPCVGGIDMAGTVVSSSDGRFAPGDQVVCTSYDVGVAHHGGYAELARVPADWVLKLPDGLSCREAMACGTAGFSAALGIVRMEANGLAPGNGPVIVTGATGGVGSVAVAILAQLGYRVTALTGKESEGDYLKGLGAADILLRQSIDASRVKPLERATWAGALDNLGGDYLAWLAASMQVGGTIASVGLAAGHAFNSTVMPFILRGVSLLGVDSVNCPMPLRRQVWQRLASDMKPKQLDAMTRILPFVELPSVFDDFLKGRAHGRIVVQIGN